MIDLSQVIAPADVARRLDEARALYAQRVDLGTVDIEDWFSVIEALRRASEEIRRIRR